MIKLENVDVVGWEAAIRGMRNPYDSWEKSDSMRVGRGPKLYVFVVGHDDKELMKKLSKAGPVHAKFRRMIVVTVDITAPLYFWKEFDTYKVGTVANSCSTMHTLANKELTKEDFSHEHLNYTDGSLNALHAVIRQLNVLRDIYNSDKTSQEGKIAWHQMIELLPSSYNQKRTVQLNYEVLSHMYESRHDHKLDEWKIFCNWIKTLPHADGILYNFV